MNNYLFQFVLSNVCISLLLAVIALLVESTLKRPQLAHLLWLLVFIKLVTPPLVSVPVIPVVQKTQTVIAPKDNQIPRAHSPVPEQKTAIVTRPVLSDTNAHSLTASITSMARRVKPLLIPLWLLSGIFVSAFSIIRVCRFNRLLIQQCRPAPRRIVAVAKHIALRLGLKSSPAIYTTQANLTPMVWWAGGNVRIVIPDMLIEKMDSEQLQWVISHEMAHVRRRDYLVRWLEWFACVCFWWNPVMWFARKALRANEEICCDQLVLSSLSPQPKTYANSLLNAIECLACPAIRPPAVASEINSGGVLRRRFKMIVSNKQYRSKQRWLHLCILLLAIIMLPFGVAFTHDTKAIEKSLGKEVAEGKITLHQAAKIMQIINANDDDDDDDDDDDEDVIAELKEEMQEYGSKLKAAVKNGRLSEKDAMAKWNHFIENEIVKELKEEVEEGEISQKDAMAFYKKIKSQTCDKAKACDKAKTCPKAKIDKKTGTCEKAKTCDKAKTCPKAKACPKDCKKPCCKKPCPKNCTKPCCKPKTTGTINLKTAQIRIQNAIKSGSMTPQQGREKMAELRKAAHAQKPAPPKKAKPCPKDCKKPCCKKPCPKNCTKPCCKPKVAAKKPATCDKAKTCPKAKAAAAKKTAVKKAPPKKAPTCDKAKTCPKSKAAAAKKAKACDKAKAPVKAKKHVKAKACPKDCKKPCCNPKPKAKAKAQAAKKYDMDKALEKIWSRLQTAVKDDKMSQQEARKKMAEIKKRMLARKAQWEKRRKEHAEKGKDHHGKRQAQQARKKATDAKAKKDTKKAKACPKDCKKLCCNPKKAKAKAKPATCTTAAACSVKPKK